MMNDARTPTDTSIWQNWNGNVRCKPRRRVHARKEADVQVAVADAAAEGMGLRVAGGGHSFGPVVSTDDVLLDLKIDGDLSVHENRAIVPGGTKLFEFLDPLWNLGKALPNMGELDTTTLTGAIATGVHGTGLSLPSVSATLSAARLVTAAGDLLEVEADSELMQAARVSMGMLGVMTETTIDTVPAYDLHEKCCFCTPDEVLEEWDEMLQGARHYSFYYLPNEKATATYSDIFPTLPKHLSGEICFSQIRRSRSPGSPFSNSETLERCDRMNRILTYTYPVAYREIEFAVPLDEGKRVFQEIRRRLRDHFPEYAHPVDVRFVAQDDALLSWCHDGPKAVFSIPESLNASYEGIMAEIELLFYKYGGLPHWGKEHRLTEERLNALQPCVARFREIRRELDPKGVFLNNHLRPLFE